MASKYPEDGDGKIEITEEEKKIVDALRKLGLKPKADTPSDLMKWIEHVGKPKEEKSDPSLGNDNRSSRATSVPTPRRLSMFHGDVSNLTKGEVVYDQWRYEVSCLVEEGYTQKDIAEAIRRSVRGEPSRVLMRLGTTATVIEILQKFDSVYGIIDTRESLLAKFYSAKQGDTEDVTSWSCRLEDILGRAIEKKIVSKVDSNGMLRSMLWTGLRTDLKNISGHKFDAIQDFDRLRIELRLIEQEQTDRTHSKVTIRSTVDRTETRQQKDRQDNVDCSKEVNELRSMLETMTSNVASMTTQMKDLSDRVNRLTDNSVTTTRPNYPQQFQGRNFRRPNNRGNRGGRYQSSRSRTYTNRPQGSNRQSFGQQNQPQQYQQNRTSYNNDLICYKCGHPGHYQWQCEAQRDHLHQGN